MLALKQYSKTAHPLLTTPHCSLVWSRVGAAQVWWAEERGSSSGGAFSYPKPVVCSFLEGEKGKKNRLSLVNISLSLPQGIISNSSSLDPQGINSSYRVVISDKRTPFFIYKWGKDAYCEFLPKDWKIYLCIWQKSLLLLMASNHNKAII